jgi:hypothetical protein
MEILMGNRIFTQRQFSTTEKDSKNSDFTVKSWAGATYLNINSNGAHRILASPDGTPRRTQYHL